jgi:hypothetical protein
VSRSRAWPAILEHAAAIVRSYDTGVTLRQLFYRLVADGTLENTRAAYGALSDQTAKARRAGTFPDLLDRGRLIHQYQHWPGPEAARGWLADVYRRDRTEGQPWSVYLGVEKAGLVAQVQAWFGDLGVAVLALGGYTSQSYVSDVRRDVTEKGRPAVLLYAGDFDPSGEDIDRDFVARSACWARVVRVALSAEQVDTYQLPPALGKDTDSRAAGFVRRHGALVQVELDALPPDTLRALYAEALAPLWDEGPYQRAVKREDDDRAVLVVG